MREGLLVIERMIVESLSKKEKNIFELSLDTNLDQGLLLNVLPNLLMNNYVNYKKGIYQIEKSSMLKWRETINNTENVKEELKEIFSGMVNEFYKNDLEKLNSKSNLKLKKIWLTKDEEVLLKGHLTSLENFFNKINESRRTEPKREKTFEQKIVMWGYSNYSDLINSTLESA